MGYGNEEQFMTVEEREALIASLLGKTVEITVDRPIGFVHVTKGITLHYTVNYGFLPGVMGGDGEEQDVYILGVSEPLERFTGRIIGVIRRRDDNEDKLVAAPEGMAFSGARIARETRFVEQYFDSTPQSIFDEGEKPMRKIFILSFDDGTIYDKRFVQLLNKYHIPCTFNLNSGLEDFVWEFEGNPVRRQKLSETVKQYRGHDIASHSLHHHLLTSLDEDTLRREVTEDCDNLKRIFGMEELGFGVPFTACGDREVAVIAPHVRYIRLSEYCEGFALPKDEYHIPIHGLFNQPDIYDRIYDFSRSELPVSLFVMAGHSYEFEFLDQWEYMEKLLQYIQSFGFEIMTTMDFVKEFYA